MQNEIVLLLKIQKKDIAIRSLEREHQLAPEALNVTKEGIDQANNTVKQKQEELKKLQLARKDLEVNLDTKLGNIKKYETQLFQIKTNEEYKALQKEINDLKFAAGLEEDKILEKMEEIEMIQKEIRKLEKGLGEAREELKQKAEEVATKLESIASQKSQLQKDRELLVSKVPEDLLNRYNRIFNNKSDVAVVPIMNSTCQGCHMKLPLNVVNEVKKGYKLIICENCARILYWPRPLSSNE